MNFCRSSVQNLIKKKREQEILKINKCLNGKKWLNRDLSA